MIEDRAVREGLPKILWPRIHMGIEMDQSGGTVPLGQGAKQWQRDAVVAAKCDEVLNTGSLVLDLREACRDLAQRNREVADVRQWQEYWIDPMRRMGAVHQHATCLTDRSRPKSGSRTIGRAEVVGNACDTNRRTGVMTINPEESGRQRESRS